MEPIIETNMAFVFIFLLAVAWFFLRKFSANPFEETLKRAMAGNAQAQYDMGYMYYQGKQVTRSYSKAFNWFDTSAKQGNVRALVALAGLYNEGKG